MNDTISDNDLVNKFLTPEMELYFYKKFCKESKEVVLQKVVELLKYLCLCVNDESSGNIPFSQEIDEVWHYWILQTKQYQELTSNLPAGKFIHHSSNDYNNSATTLDIDEVERQVSFLASYVSNFSGFNEGSIKYWPMANAIMQHLKLKNIDDLNCYIRSLN